MQAALHSARRIKKSAIEAEEALLRQLHAEHSVAVDEVDAWLFGGATAAAATKAPSTPRRRRDSSASEKTTSTPTSTTGIQTSSRTAVEVAAAVQRGTFSAVAVLISYARRAFRAHRAFNCVTESMLQTAVVRAREIDALSPARRRAMSLCGVPVSLKDTVDRAGYDTTNGLVGHTEQPAQQDALIVSLLIEAGAVPFVKSNVPQTLMSFECVNPLYGRTVNPYHTAYTCGGSSGGEAALLACSGSALGIGTDIGGSIRTPAHYCGVYGLKPTSRRFSALGFRKSAPGQENIVGCAGPMGRSVDDLAAVARLWLQTAAVEAADPMATPVLPFREEVYANRRPMRIGFYTSDAFMGASPACARAVDEACAALRRAGHEVVAWEPIGADALVRLFFSIVSADRGESLFKQVLNEQVEPMMRSMKTQVSLPSWLRSAVAALLRACGSPKAAGLLGATGERRVHELYSLVAERNALKLAFLRSWRAAKLDALVCPAGLLPAIPHDSFSQVSFAAASVMLYNILDMPAGVVPVTCVRASTDHFPTTTGAGSSDLLEKRLRAAYNADAQAGLPVGVQVVALPFEEEQCLRAMREVADAVRFVADAPLRAF